MSESGLRRKRLSFTQLLDCFPLLPWEFQIQFTLDDLLTNEANCTESEKHGPPGGFS